MKPETFLTLEKAFEAKLRTAVQEVCGGAIKEVASALNEGDTDKAMASVAGLNLTQVYESFKPTLLLHTYMGMVFGATQVDGEVHYTSIGHPESKAAAEQVVESFRGQLREAEKYLKEQAVQLIAKEVGVEKAEKEEKPRILHDFESFLNEKNEAYLNMIASLHTSRVSAYGFTAEALALGLTEYQITEQLDKRTCPVCKEMHGKTFKVADARALLEIVTRTEDPEELKSLQSWPPQNKEAVERMLKMEPHELVAKGWHIPPFHPRCRGMLTRVGRVPPIGETEVPPVSQQDFTDMGLEISEADVSLWAESLGATPAAILALLSGKELTEVLAMGKESGGMLGLLALHLTKQQLKITLKDTFGVVGVQTVSLGLQSRKLLIAEAIHLSGGTHKQFMQAMYLLSKDTGMQAITMTVAGTASFEWAQRGFYPATAAEWGQVTVDLVAKYAMIKDKLSPEMRKAVEAILKSKDPKAMLKLVDLAPDTASGIHVGRTLLDGVGWQGQVVLTEPESLTKFMGYIL